MSVTAMTQNEMVTEVANIIGRDSTSLSADQTTSYSDRIKQWLYWSHLTMARVYAFPELDADPISYTLGTSTNVYTFATLALGSVRQIMGITVIDGTSSIKLTQKLARTFAEDHPNVSADAHRKPYYYTIYGKRIEFDRISDSTYSIQVRVNNFPSNFASGSSASVYELKDDVIIAGAVTHAYISLQEKDDAADWAKIFVGRLQASIGHHLDPVDWEPEGRAFDYSSQRSSFGSPEANPLVFFNL